MSASRQRVALRSLGLTCEVDPLGAQLYALADAAGRALLWDGDPKVWTGRAPILFPIVGELQGGRYKLGDKHYALGRHGFARHKLFEVAETTSSSALFRLRPDPETRASYPFDFTLEIGFRLEGAALTLTARVGNPGQTPLPASFGFHPALRWPLPGGEPRSAHRLVFANDEPAAIRRLNSEGVVKPGPSVSPVNGRTLMLRDELFIADALIFDDLSSSSLRYGAEQGPALEVEFPKTPYLGVWTKPGADYICIEPWHGIADPAGYEGDFSDKPGIFIVAPGSSFDMTMTIRLIEGLS